MNRIITPQQIQKSVVKIVYKENEQGTGFFITPNIILTAYHVIIDESIEEDKIELILNDNKIGKCNVLSFDEQSDICLLICDYNNTISLPLTTSNIRINEAWESFGFPYQGETEGLRIYGTINQIVNDEKYNILLNCQEIDVNYNYDGLSGSPVISNGRVIGIILSQIDDKLGAISINQFENILQENNIEVHVEESINDLPRQLNNDIKNITYNYDVLNKLDESIKETGSWILLEGNPGTGKTFNIASYTPTEKDTLVLGKYFVKVPNDDKPKSLRISKEYFLSWLEETISIALTGDIPPKTSDSFEKRIEALNYNLNGLSEYLSNNNLTGLLFLDGLDEVKNIEDFLGVLSMNMPENIKIVLSCISKEILPSDIKNNINTTQGISVSPLNISQCEQYIQKELKEDIIDFEDIQKIALKSEGHPLYMRYLIDYVNNSEISNDKDELKEWIDNIPNIGGNIENYYNSIWDKIYEDKNKLWICLFLSQLRQAIDEKDFFEILSSEIKNEFYSVFPKISYLIKNDDKLEIYHNSFKEFILGKVPLLLKNCNDLIVNYCETNPNSDYSLTNILYHYGLSNSPEKAVENCNQNWADKMAFNHIEPDLVVSDIKNTISLSIDLELTTEVIRLLLLLQRIDFRYNSVFIEYAHEMTLALIANKKYKEAIKYIVRRKTLLISASDAVHFLQQFYENKAFEEATILEEAIDKEYRKSIHEGFNGQGISFQTFFIKAQTLILSSNESSNPEELRDSQMIFSKYLNLLRKIPNSSNDPSIENQNKETIQHVRDHCCAWNNAYLLRRFGMNMDVHKMMQIPEIKINDTWSYTYATSLLIYKKELNNYNLPNYYKDLNEKKLSKNVELLIENFGYQKHNDSITNIILSLLSNTSKPKLLKSIMEEYLTIDKKLEIRNKNGVDFERLNFENLCTKYNCLGFIDDCTEFKVSHKQWFHNTWEKDLLKLIEEIHFIEGKAYYYKASDLLAEKLSFIRDRLQQIIKSISFTFDYRSHWERSYQLPEKTFPLLYTKLVFLINEFNINDLDSFVESIKIKCNNQIGLYTEGYRSSLQEIIRSLISIQYDKDKILPLVKLWEEHIAEGVQNRWERTEEFLKINEISGILNFKNESETVFQKMLNTSMGPSWYKEAQLTPINTILKNLKSIPSNDVLQEFASILDYASGEMTFQRYVQDNKENFIGALIKNEKLNESLEYYKFETLPNPKTIIRNAEISSFDAPRIGDGYCLGARSIIEQSGILEILRHSKINPYLKWALCEIFTVNEDNFRYITYFGEQMSNALNEIEALEDGNIDEVIEKTAVLISNSLISKDDRTSLLIQFGKDLTVTNTKRLQGYLLNHNINWGLNEDIEKKKEKEKEKNNFDVFNDSNVDVETDITLGLNLFKTERVSIWVNNYSNSHKKTKQKLKSLFQNDKSVIKNLKEFILQFEYESWDVCDDIIWFLEDKLDDNQIKGIYKIVIEHFQFMVRPNSEVKEKYSWLESNFDNNNPDDLIINFIIWHLNHPVIDIRDKTLNILAESSKYYPLIIKYLIITCIVNAPEISTELSSSVLKEISIKNPILIKECLIDNPELEDEISKIKHFTVKKNLLEMSINLNKIGYSQCYTKIQNLIPESIILTGEVSFEEDYIKPIQDIIDDLNYQLFLDGKFCLTFNQLMDEYCQPLSKIEVVKSDKYLSRSFYNEDRIIGRYKYILRHALNNSILHRMDKNNIDNIYNIIN
ncbi:serine protease [Chryseobacterium sp.]|uniref:S1 family peptidase n=1 Tax=Chryseobacterium sp. TaxID=1871047 RepID=UPI00289B834C|nr:serine protease [Chryseobacterium sp.]